MKLSQEEIPGTQRTGFSPLLYVAVIATFLLLTFSFRTIEEPGDLGLRTNVSSGFELSSERAPAPETPELMFVAHNALRAATPTLTVTPQVLGAIMGQLEADLRPEVAMYIVQKGDTPASVAEQFGISLNTVLWANDLKRNSTLKPGQELIILPTTGALHLVRPNDTLSEIVGWYQADTKDIVSFNAFFILPSLLS